MALGRHRRAAHWIAMLALVMQWVASPAVAASSGADCRDPPRVVPEICLHCGDHPDEGMRCPSGCADHCAAAAAVLPVSPGTRIALFATHEAIPASERLPLPRERINDLLRPPITR